LKEKPKNVTYFGRKGELIEADLGLPIVVRPSYVLVLSGDGDIQRSETR